jgi:hypothetical protein
MSDTPQPSPSGLYAFTDCEMVHMLNGAVLLIDKFSDAQMLVGAPVAQSMQTCRKFRTLEQHTQSLTSTIPELAGQHADVMNVLGMVKDAGLLVSAETVCEELNQPVEPAVDLPPTRVFVITCDRPEAVDRLLESMLRAGNLSRHEALFLIDDSRDPENGAANREAIEKFNLTSPRDMHYFGAEEARLFMGELIAEAPDQEDAIRFLIDREHWADEKSYGLARNLCLLLSVGCRAIMMDDDVICTALEAPHKKEGLAFVSADREVDFYKDHQEMLARTTASGFDPLTGHAQCLGLNMGQAFRKLGREQIVPEDLAGANSSYIRLWSPQSQVVVTQNGTLGDPGSPRNDWIYYLKDDSAKRLTEFPGGLQGALTCRSHWMGHAQPSFTKMSVISQVTGVDNTQLLPPYFPIFRGEDYLFGAMTEYLHPHAAVLTYDWCVPHLPIDERASDPEPAPKDGKGNFSLGKFVTDRTVYQAGISPEARLAALAALVQGLAESGDRGLKSLYRKEVAELQGLDLVGLNGMLSDGSIRTPEWQGWLQDSVSLIQQNMQATAEVGDNPILPQNLSNEELLEIFRGYAAGFANALGSWAATREVASRISEKLLTSGL